MALCPHCGCELRGRRPTKCKFCGKSTSGDPSAPPGPTTVVTPATLQLPSSWYPRPGSVRVARPSDADLSRVELPPLPATPPRLRPRDDRSLSALLRRLISGAPPDVPAGPQRRPVGVSDGRGFNLSIVGEANYQLSLRRLSAGRRERGDEVVFRAWLVPEPGNIYDPNAVAVLLDDGKRVGYLAREWAAEYIAPLQELCNSGLAPHCRAKLTGGHGDKTHFGVVLDVRDPNDGLIGAF
jgi:hypothetical protein